MLIYITFATIIFLGGFTKQSYKIYKTSLIALFLMTAFRKPDWGGYDSLVYMRIYEIVPILSELKGFKSGYGFGYVILNSISKTIVDNYIVFQILLAVITVVLLDRIIENAGLTDAEKCFFIFSYFCYRFMWNTWVTYRQNIANLIVWLLIVILWKRNTIKGKCTLIIGSAMTSFFHSSAIANAVLIPGAKALEKISVKKRMILIVLTSLFLWFVGGRFFSFLLNFAIGNIDARYGMYSLASTGTSSVINYIFRMVIFLVLCIFYDRFTYENKDVALSTISIMVLIGSIPSELMLRMYEYYAIGLYLTLATSLELFRGKSKVIAAFIFYAVMVTIMIHGVVSFDGGVFLNYQFVA